MPPLHRLILGAIATTLCLVSVGTMLLAVWCGYVTIFLVRAAHMPPRSRIR